ncbi:MAG: NAD(P)/FAD-dependent oxidoreductase [Syntrophomonadaceae bacterium]|nr:NAD(P)/FAD-dependent oxidoreductase [Syntrophomonadaceae bacterium]
MTEQHVYDVVVIGCGPAGLSAAINVKVRNRDVVVLGTEQCSPPLDKAPRIVNYLGFTGVTGVRLREKFVEHARIMGVDIKRARVDAIMPMDDVFMVTSREEVYLGRTVIIATGTPYRPRLGGEQEFLGRGLGYCATCDGPLYRGKDVAIIAHSPEAEVEANFMGEICRKVYYLPLYGPPTALEDTVQVVEGKPTKVLGSKVVNALQVGDTMLKVDGVFIVGAETPPERLFPGIELEDNHIRVNRQQETSVPRVYAAGDCTGPPYQIAKAVGEGLVAGLAAAKLVVALRPRGTSQPA